MTIQVLTGTIVSPQVTAAVFVNGDFNVSLFGAFTATVQPERSFDGGVTWNPVTFADGSAIQWTGPMSAVLNEPESGVLYQLNCTTYGSGTITWRISL